MAMWQLDQGSLRPMTRRGLTLVGVLVAFAIVAAAVWFAIALPTGHYRVLECLRPDHGCVGEEDFRYPQRIAILVGGVVFAWLVQRGVRRRPRLETAGFP